MVHVQFQADSLAVEGHDLDLERFSNSSPRQDTTMIIAGWKPKEVNNIANHNGAGAASPIEPAAYGPGDMHTQAELDEVEDENVYLMELLKQERAQACEIQQLTALERFVAYENRLEQILVLGPAVET